MARPATVSPEQILAAAALEFAERGYEGAGVDRIARHAGVNKAMLYYHFGSKHALYRALLRQTFGRAADRLQAIAAAPSGADEKISQVIQAIAGFIAENRFFPAIVLREVADGGRHLDRDALAVMARVPLAVGQIVQQGVAAGELRDVHPMAAYFTMLAPILFYTAGEPIRRELAVRRVADLATLTPEVFVEQLRHSLRLALAPGGAALRSTPPVSRVHVRRTTRRKRI
jgi:TetR/AcrR family transcriptional regulator